MTSSSGPTSSYSQFEGGSMFDNTINNTVCFLPGSPFSLTSSIILSNDLLVWPSTLLPPVYVYFHRLNSVSLLASHAHTNSTLLSGRSLYLPHLRCPLMLSFTTMSSFINRISSSIRISAIPSLYSCAFPNSSLPRSPVLILLHSCTSSS